MDINIAIGGGLTGKGSILFYAMVDHALAGTNITELRTALRSYIYGSALTIAERASVCNVWQSLSMPGVLCDPPSRPSNIYVTNTGACQWVYNPHPYLYHASVYTVSWSNVNREDRFEFLSSPSPWFGYQVFLTLPKDATSISPYYYHTVGTNYAAVRACNESGCSGLTGAPAYDTCLGSNG